MTIVLTTQLISLKLLWVQMSACEGIKEAGSLHTKFRAVFFFREWGECSIGDDSQEDFT